MKTVFSNKCIFVPGELDLIFARFLLFRVCILSVFSLSLFLNISSVFSHFSDVQVTRSTSVDPVPSINLTRLITFTFLLHFCSCGSERGGLWGSQFGIGNGCIAWFYFLEFRPTARLSTAYALLLLPNLSMFGFMTFWGPMWNACWQCYLLKGTKIEYSCHPDSAVSDFFPVFIMYSYGENWRIAAQKDFSFQVSILNRYLWRGGRWYTLASSSHVGDIGNTEMWESKW